MLRYFNPPSRRHTTSGLSPFKASRGGYAELFGDIIDDFPGQGGHTSSMGHTVPYVKATVSREVPSVFCQTRRMATEWLDEGEFNVRFCERIARLRSERGWTQQQMARAIGVPHERYKKYETRSPMPLYLLPRFAMQVDRDVEYLLTGKSHPQARRGPRTLVRTGTEG